MAYLRGFTNDIFFSYAHGLESGSSMVTRPLQNWVLTFHGHLMHLVNDYIKGEDSNANVIGWIDDKNIERTAPVDQSLKKQVKESALFVCVMSNYYIRSKYCQDEILTFKNDYADEGDKQGRIFLVNGGGTKREAWPKPVRMENGSSIPGYDFYERREVDQTYFDPFGYPGEPQYADLNYVRELRKLAQDIVHTIVSLKQQEVEDPPPPEDEVVADPPPGPTPTNGKKVFLGFAHDTLDDIRNKIRERLEASGLIVLPDTANDPWDKASLDAALTHLPECDFAVLVVNEYCGSWPKGEPGGLVSYQMEAFRCAKKPCRLWVNLPDPTKARTEAYRAYLAALPTNRDAHFADVETFCRSLMPIQGALLEQLGATLLSNRSSDLKKYVDFQEAVNSAIRGSGRTIYYAEEGKTRIRLQDLATYMDDSDTLAIVCFDQKFPWAKELMVQLRQMSQDRSQQRRHLLVTGPVASTPVTMDARALDFETIDAADLDIPALQQKIAREIERPHG